MAKQNSSSSNPGFSARQLAELSNLIKATNVDLIASIVRSQLKDVNRNRSNPSNPFNPTNPFDPGFVTAQNQLNGFLKATDIGFFDPAYDDKDTDASALINAGRHDFYRDIYAFVDRIKDIAAIHGADKTKEAIPTCFRGEALIWHTMELSEIEKDIVRTASIEQWITILIKRFKKRTSEALEFLQSEQYTMEDARQERSPRVYA